MYQNRWSVVFLLANLAAVSIAHATSLAPGGGERQIQAAGAIFRGQVLRVDSFRGVGDGHIYTRTVLKVREVFKGEAPQLVYLVNLGGAVDGTGEDTSLDPRFKAGEERLVFVTRNAEGALCTPLGQASALPLPADALVTGNTTDPKFAAGLNRLEELRRLAALAPIPGDNITDQTAEPLPQFTGSDGTGSGPKVFSATTNLSTGVDGIPSRFILPDRGEPISYYVDADFLPSGVTQTAAVTAVQTALTAWANATSVRYAFAGMRSFGQSAINVVTNDGALRIQLHDRYNSLASSGGDVLGTGGRAWITSVTPAGWTSGGNVGGNDFHKTVRAFIVLQHTNIAMQDLKTFTEVLTHELGHTLGMMHSSENAAEPSPSLRQAIMYYTVHADGRGAALTLWDTNVSRQAHPSVNTPPYCYDRFLDVVTSPIRPLAIPGVNTVQVRGYDVQTTNLTFATNGATTNNGAFSMVGSNVTYVPREAYSDSTRVDPASGSYYDLVYARFSDGVNASPYASVKVLSYNLDSYSEGIPDAWRVKYFGSANPGTGAKHHAADDADADGYYNLVEYWLGSNPTNRASNLALSSSRPFALQWPAKAYEVYEVQGSTDLRTWTRAMNPVVPSTTKALATPPTNAAGARYFRVLRVP